MSEKGKWIVTAVVILLIAYMYRPAKYVITSGNNYGVYLYDKYSGRSWRMLITNNSIEGWQPMLHGPAKTKAKKKK